jgi:glutamine amidotransferase
VNVAIVDYGAGNLRSAAKAFEIAGRAVGDVAVVVTLDPDVVARADRVVLPGDGAYADCRSGLAAVPGLDEAITEVARRRGRPFLGICVGMQLLTDRGLEHRVTPGLGWIPGECVPIVPSDPRLKVPHMGWNTLRRTRAHPLLDDLSLGPDGLHAYFLHGYHVHVADPADRIATADYGGEVTAIVARGNILGMQFHPEKSQRLGLALVERFLRWTP